MTDNFIRGFSQTKAMFHLPDDMIYLDGNSLGPLPKAAAARINDCVTREWGEMVITGWNRAGWMAQPTAYADRIGRLIGAEPGHCVLGDTLSVKVFQALAAALDLVPDRKVILTDSGNFPSDIYMAEGLIKSLDRGYELKIVPPEDVAHHINDDLAVLMLTQVDYRTGRLHDMPALTAAAHDAGALAIWDLAHSAGALAVDVASGGADFAVGCTYKYLNGGPGAPAFIYVAPRHIDRCQPALSGWLGHAAPFAFEPGYRPGTGIERMRVGTPPVLQLAALDASLDIWDRVDLDDIRTASMALTQQFIDGVEASCPMLTLASPRDPAERGSQVSFRFADGYAAMQACIAHGVVGDFRAPDIMRFGFTPLFIDADDVTKAVAIISRVMQDKLWDAPAFRQKAAVT
ncbi:MAG: kynureninase [Loktanella sp.]|nr:kynureninase [Loktanella sp.]